MGEAALDPNPQKQKRARSQLSCMPCRVGKLKCNRVRDPACDQCIKRNRETACQYVPAPTKARPTSNVKGRIRQLETLVKDLMVQQDKATQDDNANSTDQPTPPSDNDDRQPQRRRTNIDANVETSLGQLDISGGSIAYTGENHWHTILASLNDIQKDLAEEDGDVEDNQEEKSTTLTSSADKTPASAGAESSIITSNFILGHTKRRTREELINAVPEKRICDRLLSSWFNSADPFKIIIHAPTFQEEYKQFQQGQPMPTMWFGLLFAILTLAESFGLRNQAPSSPGSDACFERVQLYQSLTASAAVLAEYTKPREYTVECLLLYMVGLRNDNAAMNAWIVMGIIVRLSMRMGYHRDPGHYAKLSAFQAEMRRRVWTMTHMIDVLMSFQLGLPSMMRTVASDTQPPRNLLDRDFNKTMTFLPAPRGETELTPSLYTQTKLRIIHVFAQAAELSHATVPPTIETVDRLNAELEEAKNELPIPLQMPDISELVTDPAEQLMCRFNIDLLYSKCKIVLFRRYMLVPLTELSDEEQMKGIGAGRKACIDSARRVLDHHHTIYSAIQPGGQLENMRWYMGSIAVHDFLLAAMVVCLELSQQLHRDKMLRISGGMNCPTRQAMLRALEKSYNIWTNTTQELSSTIHNDQAHGYKGGDMYEETEKASKAMAAMLSRIKVQENQRQDSEPIPPPSAKQTSIFEEKPGTYFDNIGLTVDSARDARRHEGFTGVLTVHAWDSVPDNINMATLNYTPDSSAYNGNTIAIPTGLTPGYVTSNTDDYDDPMALDWQAWDDQIYNRPDTDAGWTQTSDLPTADANPQINPAAQQAVAGLNFTDEELASFEFGSDSHYTPFIQNEKTAPWPVLGRR